MNITNLIRRIVFFAAGVVLFVLVMEALLWLLPVNTRIKLVSTDRDVPVVRAQPHQSYVYSHGWDFMNVASGVTNNIGMLNSIDYENDVPAVGVVGDSFIEARMLSYGETLQGNLDRWAESLGYRVYAASTSGAGLADYLALAGVSHRETALRMLVVLINERDIMDALAPPVKGYSGLLCAGGKVAVRHVDYIKPESGFLRRLAGSSALIRYLDFNLKVVPWLTTKLSGKYAAAGGTPVGSLDHACLLDYFYQMSRVAGLPPEKIVFILDGMRDKVDKKKEPDKYLAAIQALKGFRKAAQTLGFRVIDMQPVFDEAHHRKGMRVDFNPRDNHWNGLGHELAAREVLKVLKENSAESKE